MIRAGMTGNARSAIVPGSQHALDRGGHVRGSEVAVMHRRSIPAAWMVTP